MKCEKCNKTINGKYGSGRFCSKNCANSRLITDEVKKKISDGIKKSEKFLVNNKIAALKRRKDKEEYICEKCQKKFLGNIKRGRKIHCENCKRKVCHYQDISKINSILDLSLRTSLKILDRLNLKKCLRCNWDESSCDIHHIHGRKILNANEHKNLTLLCPNCHRLAHTKKIEIKDLEKINLEVYLKNWKEFYYTSHKNKPR